MRFRWWLTALAVGVSFVLAAYWTAAHWGGPYEHAIDRRGAIVGTGGSLPNVIVIVLDTTRADHLGVYGFEPDSTPFLSELAEQSVVFERAFSVSSWTAPATASVFTGQYPWNHGIVDGFRWHRKQVADAKQAGRPVLAINRFRPDSRTMPEYFRGLGYATIGLASNINIGPEIGFDRGFDRFIRDRADAHGGILGAFMASTEPFEESMCARWGVCGLQQPFGTAASFRRKLGDWREEIQAAEPYFLYLHFNDPHRPYRPRPSYFRSPTTDQADEEAQRLEALRANYLSEIAYVDAQIEEIFRMAFRDDNTLFVVVSDHGEAFGDHGNVGHSTGLHAELNRIVMMVHGPGLGIDTARITDVNVSQIDLLPTLLDLLGAPVPFQVDGLSLAPLLRGDADAEPLRETLTERVLFAHRRGGGEWFAAIDGPWKLIRSGGGQYELFDLERDPHERVDRLEEEEDIVGRLRPLLLRFDDESMWKRGGVSEVRAGEALKAQLKALGYVE